MKDIKSLDLNLLKALEALLDERNVTRAAAKLGVTQPAMSGMLTRLRETFDDPLFVRSRHGMIPTPHAEALTAPVRQVICEISELIQPAIFDPASARLTYTIAATDYAFRAVAVPFIALLKQHAPQIRVSLVAIRDSSLQQQLERGEIDLALISPENSPPEMHARSLYDECYVCVVREAHPVVQQWPITPEQFCAMDHALGSYTGGGFYGVTDEALQPFGLQRQVTLSVQSFAVLPDILRASDMIAVLPSRLVKGIQGLAVLEPPIPIPGFTNSAVWHERTHRDSAHRWLRDLLFQICLRPCL